MGLLKYIIRRLLMLVLMLLALSVIIFAITMLFSPLQRALLYIDNPHELDRKTIEMIIRQYGFDQPAPIQYLNWLGQILQGNLGYSQSSASPVLTALLTKLSRTAEIILPAILIVVFVGAYLGAKSAKHRDKPFDHATRTLSIASYSLPTFWLGILSLAVFFGWLGWLPPGTGGLPLGTHAIMFVTGRNTGWKTYTGLYTIDGILNGQLWITLDAIRHLILPVAVVTLSSIAIVVLVVRLKMLEMLRKRYVAVTTAKELTLSEATSKRLRINVLFPATTFLGLVFATMLISIILTETIFAINGLGRWVAEAAGAGGSAPDVAAIVGFALLTGLIFVIASFTVDIIYAYVDPRIRQRNHSHIEINQSEINHKKTLK